MTSPRRTGLRLRINAALHAISESETYRLYAPVIAGVCVFVATCSSIGTFAVYRTQAEEATRRVQAIAGIQQCFDEYAAASSATSKAVRRASVAVSEATAKRDAALNRWAGTVLAFIGGRTDLDDVMAAITAFTAAGHRLDVAADRLDLVRETHPVPDPPSSFCPVQP
ncbi:hypothetical protein GCM10022215_24060 [Nocardioides fonticola]|uniref:Uncharacterized protein n=1 Tax=Nocardioides fonticola TaxID=450363 RepID=A0ABP7XJT7_9ACTN